MFAFRFAYSNFPSFKNRRVLDSRNVTGAFMIHKLPRSKIQEFVSLDVKGISERNKEEMAIPSYLHINPLIRWLMWKRYEFIAELAKPTKDMAVLEFGCGIGVFLPTLSNLAGSIYAIDLFPDYAKNLVKNLRLPVMFIDHLSSLTEESVDIIIAADVMEHLDDPTRYILIFKNKLKRRGKLIVSGPTENIAYKLSRIFAGFGKKEKYHHTNIDELRTVIEKSGFRLIETRTLPFKIPPFLFKIFEFERI